MPDARRWRPVAAYALLAAATQLLWLTFAPLTTASAHHYRVSETAIGWLAEIFPLFYVVLALPAGRLLDRSFHRWLAVGAVLTALGGCDAPGRAPFGWALLGQLLVAIGQPLVLNAVTKVASEHLPPRLRPHGIAVGSAGIFVGMLLALTLGTLFGGAHLQRLLELEAAFSVVAAAALLFELRLHGARGDAEPDVALGIVALARGLGRPQRASAQWTAVPGLRRLRGADDVASGAAAQLPHLLDDRRRPARGDGAARARSAPPCCRRWLSAASAERGMVAAAVAVTVGGACVLAFEHVIAIDAVVLVVIGLLLLTLLPVILELSERRAGASAGTVTSLLWLAGNAGGLVDRAAGRVLVHHPTPAFLVLALVSLCAAPLVLALSTD